LQSDREHTSATAYGGALAHQQAERTPRMSAVSARRRDARQTGLPSRRLEYRPDRRGEERRHRPGAGTLQHVGGRAHAVSGVETSAGVPIATPPSQRCEQVGSFYARQASWLRRVVATRVLADEHTIEDACAHAWERLSADARGGGFPRSSGVSARPLRLPPRLMRRTSNGGRRFAPVSRRMRWGVPSMATA
jgi:hypothetical protein